MTTGGYAFHREAEIDLEEIWDYNAADSVAAADRLLAEFHDALEIFGSVSEPGPQADRSHDRPLRFKRVRDYLIAYAPDEKPLWVIAIMHGHRSPRVMAAILRGREE